MDGKKITENDIKDAIDVLKRMAISEMSSYDGSDYSFGRCEVYYELLNKLIKQFNSYNLDIISFGLNIDLDKLCPPRLSRKIVVDNKFDLIDDKDSRDYLISEFKRSLIFLTDKERKVIEYRFGINTGKPLSLRKVSDKLGVSAERVRQIESDAIERIIKSTENLNKEKIERIRPVIFESSFREKQLEDINVSLEGKNLKNRLAKNHLSQSWLVSRLALNGLKIDNSYLSLTLSGVKNTEKARTIISLSNTIIDSYEAGLKEQNS